MQVSSPLRKRMVFSPLYMVPIWSKALKTFCCPTVYLFPALISSLLCLPQTSTSSCLLFTPLLLLNINSRQKLSIWFDKKTKLINWKAREELNCGILSAYVLAQAAWLRASEDNIVLQCFLLYYISLYLPNFISDSVTHLIIVIILIVILLAERGMGRFSQNSAANSALKIQTWLPPPPSLHHLIIFYWLSL